MIVHQFQTLHLECKTKPMTACSSSTETAFFDQSHTLFIKPNVKTSFLRMDTHALVSIDHPYAYFREERSFFEGAMLTNQSSTMKS